MWNSTRYTMGYEAADRTIAIEGIMAARIEHGSLAAVDEFEVGYLTRLNEEEEKRGN